MDLDGRNVVVTGGAKGIGYALAEAFIGAGAATVTIADLDIELVSSAAERLGERVHGEVVDVSDVSQLTRLVGEAEDRGGPIDLFVSNAGVGTALGLDADDATWDRTWQVNVMAHVHAAQAVIPSMVARGEGYLLSTASAAGLLTQLGDLPYSVTKHAAVAVAEWLAITYGHQGVKVSCLCPQYVRTDMVAEAVGTPVEQLAAEGMIEPSDVADSVLAGLATEQFLILPHPEIAEYYRRRATDTDRWLAGMRRLQTAIASLSRDP